MEVEYTLKPADLQAFSRYHHKTLGRVPGKLLLIAIVGSLGIAFVTFTVPFPLGLLEVFQGTGVLAVLLGLLLGWLGASLAQIWWQVWMNRANWKVTCEDHRSEWAVRDVRVILSPDRLHTVTRASTSTYCWSVVWRIAVPRDHVFLYLTGNTAIIIPRRAFCDVQHFEEFVALARQYQAGPNATGILASLPPESSAITRSDAS